MINIDNIPISRFLSKDIIIFMKNNSNSLKLKLIKIPSSL